MTDFEVKAVEVDCPYCGETISLDIDCSQSEAEYVEDCQVCCRPMDVSVTVDEEGVPSVDVSSQDEA